MGAPVPRCRRRRARRSLRGRRRPCRTRARRRQRIGPWRTGCARAVRTMPVLSSRPRPPSPHVMPAFQTVAFPASPRVCALSSHKYKCHVPRVQTDRAHARGEPGKVPVWRPALWGGYDRGHSVEMAAVRKRDHRHARRWAHAQRRGLGTRWCTGGGGAGGAAGRRRARRHRARPRSRSGSRRCRPCCPRTPAPARARASCRLCTCERCSPSRRSAGCRPASAAAGSTTTTTGIHDEPPWLRTAKEVRYYFKIVLGGPTIALFPLSSFADKATAASTRRRAQ